MLLKQDPANRSLLSDNQVLTNELVNVNRELTKLKAENRLHGESSKKIEKENIELKKSQAAKQNALDKLRKERDELWAIVNTEKYKSIQSLEQDMKRAVQTSKDAEDELEKIKLQREQVEREKAELEGQIKEVKYENEMLRERDSARERLVQTLEDKSRRQLEQLDKDQSMTS